MATKFHFSSNWTSRVRGGNGHELVVEALRLVAGHGDVAGHGVPADAGQPAGGADADALADVVEDGDDTARNGALIEGDTAVPETL